MLKIKIYIYVQGDAVMSIMHSYVFQSLGKLVWETRERKLQQRVTFLPVTFECFPSWMFHLTKCLFWQLANTNLEWDKGKD